MIPTINQNQKNLPSLLKEKKQWVLWKLEEKKNNKKTKVPYQINGYGAKSNDSSTWASYDEVSKILENDNGIYSGIGFMFNDDVIGIDFDHIVQDGVIQPEFREWVEKFGSYAELSQSGTGIHILTLGKIPGEKRRKEPVEIYTKERFFVMTGNLIDEKFRDIKENQPVLEELYKEYFENEKKSLPVTIQDKEQAMGRIQEQLTEKGFNPVSKGNYLLCTCPECKKDDAFVYPNRGYFSVITCNHRTSCGWKSNLKTVLGISDISSQITDQEILHSFEKHGLDLGLLQHAGIVSKEDASIHITEDRFKALKKDKKNNKLGYRLPKDFTAEMGEFYPVLYESTQEAEVENILYVFEGEWDWMKGLQDGLNCTSSLFGCTYKPQHDIGWNVFVPFKEICICYDMDKVGMNAASELGILLKNKFPDKQVDIIKLPMKKEEGKDYCDYRLKHTIDDFLALEKVLIDPQSVNASKQIMEANHKTFKLEKTENREIYNFIMRIHEKIVDDDKNVSWRIRLDSELIGEDIIMDGGSLNILNDFKKKISEKGLFLSNANTFDHNSFLDMLQKKSNIKETKKTQYLGRVEPDKFLFNNALVTNTEILKKDNCNILAPKGRLEYSEALNIEDLIEKLGAIYDKDLWKIFGFAVGSLFVEEISSYYGFFPLLFINGSKGTGKSTLAEIIAAMFGACKELKPFNFNSTTKSIQRAGAKYKGMPIRLNEYQAGKANSNALLCAMYDREGYQRAKSDNSLDGMKSEINATFIIISTQNIVGFEAEAVLSRIVEINLDNALRDKTKLEEIRSLKDNISHFVVHCLQKINPDDLLRAIKTETNTNLKALQGDERIIENHSIVQVCANEFYRSCSTETLNKWGINIGQLKQDISKQEASTKEANVGQVFLNILETLIRKKEIPEDIAKLDIAEENIHFSLPTSFPLVQKFCNTSNIAMVDKKTLAKELKQIGLESKDSRVLTRKNQKVWTYKILSEKETDAAV